MMAKGKQKTSRSASKRWLFRASAILLGLLPFLIIEFCLRTLGLPEIPASDDPLVDLHQLKPLFVRTKGGESWEIPSSRYNFFRPESFPAQKQDSEFRIFVLGGSTVQGRPFAVETAFSTWLELALNATNGSHDSRTYNTINCGGISYASYRLAPILDEVLLHKPDLIILYMGHNEFLEERSYQHFKYVPRNIAQGVRLLGSLRITQLAAQLSRRASDSSSDMKWVADSEVKTRLDVSGGLSEYHRDPTWRNDVVDHFQRTLSRMMERCGTAGVPLIVCVPASDIVDTPPFKVEHSPDLPASSLEAVRNNWQIATQPQLNATERISACQQILDYDPQHAGAAYILGKLLMDRQDYAQAKKWLLVARDWDVCPLRAPTELQQIVVEQAAQKRVPHVDVAAMIDRLDRQGLPGSTAFVDHVHPTIESHQKIALWILDKMAEMEFTSPRDSFAEERQIQSAFVQHITNLGEDYFLRGKQRLDGLRQWAAGRAGEMSID